MIPQDLSEGNANPSLPKQNLIQDPLAAEEEEEETRFSFITGTIKKNLRADLSKDTSSESSSKDLITTQESGALTKYEELELIAAKDKKSWKGLEFGAPSEPAKLEEGLSGIPMNYQHPTYNHHV